MRLALASSRFGMVIWSTPSSWREALAATSIGHQNIIEVTDKAFDDFAGGETDQEQIRKMLGLS